MSRVERIFIASDAGEPMVELSEANVIAGQGLAGDRYVSKTGTYSWGEGNGRQLTIMEAEVIHEINDGIGIPFLAEECRRNIVSRGLVLNPLVGMRIRIGRDALIDVTRLCHPCNYLQSLLGRPVLKPLTNKGGIRCDVFAGGVIRTGDAIEVVGPIDPPIPGVGQKA